MAKQTPADDKIELPDTIQVGLLNEAMKNHQVAMGDLAFGFAAQRYGSMYTTRALELGHMSLSKVLDGVVANELLVSDDPMMAGLMNMFSRVPTTLVHPAYPDAQPKAAALA